MAKPLRSFHLAALARVCFLGVIIQAGVLTAGEIEYTLKLHSSEINLTSAGDYSLVSFEGARYDDPAGFPLTPFMVKHFLLPRGTRTSEVSIKVLSVRTLKVAKPLYPAQPPRPLSAKDVAFVGPREDIYSSTVPLSDFKGTLLYEGLLEGERIASIALHPVRYTPKEGKIEVAELLVITIRYEQDPRYVPPAPLFQGQRASLEMRLAKLVENPQVFRPLSWALPLGMTQYRHVIVTPSALRNSFQPLAEWNTIRGIRDTVVTLESILAGFPGRDPADKIRNFVKYAHDNFGLEYLLLGGDADIVPTRDCYPLYMDGDHYDTIPTDMYFGCLDGNWDANGNGVYGETDDSTDLDAEVAVGRACVDNPAEAILFVGKVLSYEKNPPQGFASKLMLPSEVLWDFPYYPGDATNDAIAAMSPPETRVERLYETRGALSSDILEDSLNAGVGLAHHMAHGNVTIISTGPDYFEGWRAYYLKNSNRLAVYVAISCLVGAFDFKECIVEEFIKAPQGGTVAWVGNSRYGWGSPPVRGPSEDLDVSFFDEVYSHANPEAGPSLSAAKEEYADMGSDPYWAWCIYELNLHGDPAISVHSREISEFIVTYAEPTEGPQSFRVSVASKAGYPVEGMLVCARQGSSVYAWALTDASGDAYLEISLAKGLMSLSVTGANHLPWLNEGIGVGERKPELAISPDTSWIDAEIEPLNSSFNIASTGTDTLRVYEITPYQTAWIDSIYPTGIVLPPSVSKDVEFFVDTTNLRDSIYLGHILIQSNDPARQVVYHPVKLIKGDWPDIAFDPEPLVFSIPSGDPLTKEVTVSNEGRLELEVSSVSYTSSWIKDISPTSMEVSVGGSTGLSVTVDTQGVGFGTKEGYILFATNDPDELQRKLAVVLEMGAPDIALSPDTLQFFWTYDEEKGKTEDDFTVHNEGNRTLKVTRISPSRPWILVSGPTEFELEPGSPRGVHVEVITKGLKQGVYNAYISIYSNDPDEEVAKEPVRLVIKGSPPSIVCLPDPAIMDRAKMRGSFWVRNDGINVLRVSSVTSQTPWIAGIYPSSFSIGGHDSLCVVMIGDSTKIQSLDELGYVLLESNDPQKPSYNHPVKLGYVGVAEALPKVFELSEVSPNPSKGQCLVRFAVPHETSLSLALYDVTGQKVRTFVDGVTPAGYHLSLWNGEDDVGRLLPQGVYLLRMQSPEYRAVRKLILLR